MIFTLTLKYFILAVTLPIAFSARDGQRKLLLHSHSKETRASARRQRMRYRGASTVRGSANGPPEEIEEWKDHGEAVASMLSEKDLIEFSSNVDWDAYDKELKHFIDKRFSRFVADPGNKDAATYIKEEFKNMGLEVSQQIVEDSRIQDQITNLLETEPKAPVTTAKHTNVIGMLKGTDLANEVVLVGAHYDSVNWENTADTAPGVDDNGSGSALVLALARTFAAAKGKFKPRRSLMFVAFNGEEEGLVGSEHFAKMYKDEGKDKYGELKAAFIADEVAYPGRGNKRQVIFETKGQESPTNAMVDTLALMAQVKNSTDAAAGDGIGDGEKDAFVVNYNGFGSDHISFLSEGFPAVLIIERDDDYHAEQWGHSARDTFEHVDTSYGAAMTRLVLRAMAAFANPKT